MILEFEVPGVPVPYQRPGQGRNGQRFTESKSAGYMARVREAALRAVRGSSWPHPSMVLGKLRGPEGAFVLSVRFVREAKRGDLDNLIKSVCDALTKAAVWRDDALVVELRATMTEDKRNPRTMVAVELKGV